MTINSRVGGKTYRYPAVTVNMTDRDVIERVASMFGTSVYKLPLQPDRKQSWRAQTSGKNAVRIMLAVYPWLGVRRQARVDEVLHEDAQRVPTDVSRRASCSAAAAKRPRSKKGQFTQPTKRGRR